MTERRTLRDAYPKGPFVVAVAILGVAAVLSGPVASWAKIKLAKTPISLKAPLASLAESEIAPYRVVDKRLLEPAIVEELGTEQYIAWTLEDTSVPPTDPLHRANLFVSYYTGGGYLVPHTPDICFVGHGYQKAVPHEYASVDVTTRDTPGGDLPIRVCTFRSTALFNRRIVTVVYTFHASGAFVAPRDSVRVRTGNPFHTHAYFSKVEVSFPAATREQSVVGATRILSTVLPVLIRDHWPNFAEAERQAAQ